MIRLRLALTLATSLTVVSMLLPIVLPDTSGPLSRLAAAGRVGAQGIRSDRALGRDQFAVAQRTSRFSAASRSLPPAGLVPWPWSRPRSSSARARLSS
jgi:hypothetical protein